jgi:hypothetical protein
LRQIPYLKRLNLRWANVGDAGMEHVCKLAALEGLVLVGAEISDASVRQLARLRNLDDGKGTGKASVKAGGE